MSLSFCVLGSGSSGNCTLVICDDHAGDNGSDGRWCILIDAGLSPRTTARRMKPLGVKLHEIRAVLLTHLDHDHFHCGWLRAIERYRLPMRIHVHQRHRNAAWHAGLTMRCSDLFTGAFELEPSRSVRSFLCAHDDLGSVGFVIEHAGLRLGYATDLGRVPDALFEHFDDLHALAIESNYDRNMQVSSGRPTFLKRRIMGGVGHLSNEQALEAVRRIDSRSRLSHVALLHLSRECNDPELVRQLYRRQAPQLVERLTITHHRHPSAVLKVTAAAAKPSRESASIPIQLSLFEAFQAAGSPVAT